MNKKRSEKSKEPMERLMRLLKQGIKLGYSMTGQNTTDFDKKNLKIASPRFLSVVPEKDEKDAEEVVQIFFDFIFFR